ncbi:MAG TPA: molybdopterin molybdenumtransferase MoeA [Microbacteriaceae bacterium]|jgi:molybdopterin molybdotransferase|nr:molybdopterin molybdenumtransferase MoeA [Microbacteriaceae bacterium]
MNTQELLATTVDEHAALVGGLIETALAKRATETVLLADALDRITAGVVFSPVDLPLFRNAQMDGFAVRSSDLASVPATLPVVGEIAARATTPGALETGTAVRIMTGAVVPEGADAVIPLEDTDADGDSVTIRRSRTPGEYVRERGSDLREGAELLPGGLRLAPRHLAALAAAGLSTVDVIARPRVAVVTTGAELVRPGREVELGEIYDSNLVALTAALRAAGADVTLATRVGDDVDALLAALQDAATTSDIIITSGGISKGEYEVVRELFGFLRGTVGEVAMQPGGPQATADIAGIPVIGFPGNPVSTQVSFEVFVAPILREASQLPAGEKRSLTLAGSVSSVRGKRQFLRGKVVDGDRVEVVAGPGSHLVAGLAASDVLIDVPVDTTELDDGDSVETWTL